MDRFLLILIQINGLIQKTYKDLINEGYEAKSYSISDIQTGNGLLLLLFVTALQKDKDIYECQEYQTMDQSRNFRYDTDL